MIQSKKINIIVAAAVVFALIVSIALVVIGNIQMENGAIKTEAEYAAEVFGTDIISIEIIADEADWQEMLDNAASEQYIMADVIVNGTKFQNVGIRPKGNSSLREVVNSDSDRYSFRLKFDEYIKDQTCFGLESFVVNNMVGDNTYMKEYVSYDLMREAGVDAPYVGYADIKVNGESWGLYLAVELYNESYEQRVFGDTLGMLYNVKSMDVGGGQQPGQQEGNAPMPDGDFRQRPGIQQDFQNNAEDQASPPPGDAMPDSNPPPDTASTNNSPQMAGEKGGRGSSGGSLEYIDDNVESYSSIFNNVVGKGTESDFQRVVQALKALSEGEELETYFDVDQILRYLAAHTIVVNLDSYSSSMAQNYYIYERDGKITVLPWDYNLAWGGFQSTSASSVINFPIDTPLSGVEMSSRPLIEKLFANPEYLERYHSYLQMLIDNYFANGKFEEKINTLDALISDYVKNDATAFCTYEEYNNAVSNFITLGNLRAESVQGQLDGTIPSTTAEQNENPDLLISAEDLNLSDLGSMMGGGKGGNNGDFPGGMAGQDKNIFPGGMNNEMDTELMSKAMDIIRQANGEVTDEVKEELLSIGLTAEQIEQLSAMGGERVDGMRPGGQAVNNPPNRSDASVPADAGAPADVSAPAEQGLTSKNLAFIGVLSLVLIAAILFAARFKRNY